MVVWDEENVVHLLNRAGFGPKPTDIKKFLKRGQALSVELLVGQKPSKAKGPGKPSNENAELKKLTAWWAKRMEKQNARRLEEKMVLFWSDHFATQFSVVKNVRRMSYQNRTFRQFGMGDMRTLMREITRDAAMLEFLDGDKNKKNSLNENFGRELLELFSIGLHSHDGSEENYTQDDVIAATKATTGYQVDRKKDIGYFNPSRFDNDDKTIFAGKPFEVTGNLGIEDGNGNLLPPETNLIDALFRHTDSFGNLTMPRFIGKKLWEWFAYPDPAAPIIDEVTANFRNNGHVISDLLRDLFLHDEFYSAQAKSSSVKNPCEFLFSAMRALDAKSKHTNTANALKDMGMELFEPPSVNGWGQGQAWLSSGQNLARFQIGQAIASGRDKDTVFLKTKGLIPKGATTEAEVVDEVLGRLGIASKTPAGVRQALIDYFEGQTDFTDEMVVEKKVRGMIALALQLPETSIQ